MQWCFSQVKGTLEDDVTEGKFDLCLLGSRNSLCLILSVYTSQNKTKDLDPRCSFCIYMCYTRDPELIWIKENLGLFFFSPPFFLPLFLTNNAFA